jgi:hypothetical protein
MSVSLLRMRFNGEALAVRPVMPASVRTTTWNDACSPRATSANAASPASGVASGNTFTRGSTAQHCIGPWLPFSIVAHPANVIITSITSITDDNRIMVSYLSELRA